MASAKEQKRTRPRILRWRGVMSDSSLMFRFTIALSLAMASAVLSFTQLGFVSVTAPDGTSGYLIVLLQVVALGSLLLGTAAGAAIGLVTGGILLLHAQILPLDHYELAFVTPVTSVGMLALTGFLLGILFAFVLRNNPSSQVKRAIYVFIVCALASLLYSLGFAANVIVALATRVAESFGSSVDVSVVQQLAGATATQLGDFGIQTQGTGLLMAALCILADYLARKALAHQGAPGLRTVFGAWLTVVVTLSFTAMAAVSFGVASADGLHDAEDSMKGEIKYLCDQMNLYAQRSELLAKMTEQGNLDYDKVDAELLVEVADLFEDRNVLEGYEADSDGIVFILIDEMIYACNDERFKDAGTLDEAFTTDARDAILKSMETGSLERFVFTGPATQYRVQDAEDIDIDSIDIHPTIAYACAGHAYDYTTTVYREDNKTEQGKLEVNVVIIRDSDMVFAKRPDVMASMTLSSLVLLVVVFALVFYLLNHVVARRIDEENAALEKITAGQLDARAEAGGTREFESLSEGINSTVSALRGWISEAESRMDAELATARAIQESALPRIFPPYPDIVRFDIYASMEAAKEVGGDFYDFFLIGDDCGPIAGKLGFLVADVSGKGVPAALFMMKAKALLRDYMGSGMELGEAVSEANRQLVEGNDEGMFVTAWVGVLDYATYHVDYVNAGHNPPLIWQREGGWQWLRKKSGPVLGLMELPYRAHSLESKPGDTLLLYTDGVTEAFDVDEKLYGEERLLDVAEKSYRLHPRELLEAVRADVAAHAAGAEQSDDITILTLEVGVPPEITATLNVPAKLDRLDAVNEFLHAELERRLCPQRVQNQLDIAVEELFVNVCRYAYPDATPEHPGSVRIQRTFNADPPSITVDIIDEGVPFDPLAKPDAVTPDAIEDVPIGGLGILMAKKCTDEMYYERQGDTNVVTIVKKWC